MTAQSSVNFSKFGEYFRYKLRGLSPLIVLTSIFAFLSYPVGFFCVTMTSISYDRLNALMPEEGANYVYDIESNPLYRDVLLSPEWTAAQAQYDMWKGIMDVMLVVMIVALGAMFLMGYFIIMRNFRYIHQKRFVDMDYSLPISEQTRFLGDFLSGLAAYLIPHIAALGIGLGFYANGIARNYSYLSYTSITDIPIAEFMFIGLLSCVMFYCLSLLAVVCCGRTTEAGIAPVAINAALPVITDALRNLSLITCSYEASSDRVFSLPFAVTSPMGLLITAVFSENSIAYHSISESAGAAVLTTAELCGAIIITLIYAAAAMAIALKRRNERVGEPYVIKPMRHIVNAAVTLAAVSLFSVGSLCAPNTSPAEKLPYFIAMFILTFVLYVILELISGKGFKKFPKTLLGYAATVGGSLLLCLLMPLTNGFGAEQRVPAPTSVKAVSGTMFCRDNETWRDSYDLYNILLTDPAIIEKMTEMHTQSNVLNAETDIYVRVEYLMKSGNTMSRQLNITAKQAEDFLRAYTGSADYKQKYSFINEPFLFVTLDSSCSDETIDPEAFRQALISDVEALDFDGVYNSKELGSGVYASITIANDSCTYSLLITPYLKNSYAYLVDNGFWPAADAVSDADAVVLAKVSAQPICDPESSWATNLSFANYSAADFISGDIPADNATYSDTKYESAEDYVVVDANSAEFTELMGLCTGTPVIYGDECEYTYVLYIIHDDNTPIKDFVYLTVPSGLERAAEIFDSLEARQAA